MCLNDIDLAPFLSASPPAPPDVWLEVSLGEAEDTTEVFKAHRWGPADPDIWCIYNESC